MIKKLNESALASELSNSAFFQPLDPSDTPSRIKETAPVPVSNPTPALEPPPDEVPSVRPTGSAAARRAITRYAFEFFQDQIVELRSISLRQKLAGEAGSMSEMVRDAVDEYLAKRKELTGRR